MINLRTYTYIVTKEGTVYEEKYGTKNEDHMKSTCTAIYTYTHTRSITKITPWQTDTCTNGIVSTSRNHVDI